MRLARWLRSRMRSLAWPWLALFVQATTTGCNAGEPESPKAWTPTEEERFAAQRASMVEEQLALRDVTSSPVLSAMLAVPRHRFVPPSLASHAYDDNPLPIGYGQTISQPYIVAIMTQLANAKSGDKVLEVGTGAGYQAAVLAKIVGQVYTIEIDPGLAKTAKKRLADMGYANVHVRAGDGYQGWPEEAPFDSILVTAAPNHVPQPLIDQLKVGGRLVIPVGDYYQQLRVITRTPTGVRDEPVFDVRFVPMTGEAERHGK